MFTASSRRNSHLSHSVLMKMRIRASIAIFFGLICVTTSLDAQGLASVAIPKTGENSEVAYHSQGSRGGDDCAPGMDRSAAAP